MWLDCTLVVPLPFKPKFKVGGCHRIDSMQAVKSTGAPVIQIDELDAGGSLCSYQQIYETREDRSMVFFRSTLYRKYYERKPRSQKSGVFGLKFDRG